MATASFGRRTATMPIRTRRTSSSPTGSSSDLHSDLSEVVLQMSHIIAHEIVESCRLFARNWFPRKLVEIVACPFAETLVLTRNLHDVRDVQVEITPKIDQLAPWRFAVPLQRNPGVLLITIKQQIVLELCAHEPLMVV